MFASISNDRTLKLWDSASGEEQRTFRAQNERFTSFDISPDGRQLVTLEIGGMASLWDLHRKRDNLRKTFQLGPPGGSINRVTFTPDGRHLVTANANGTVYVLRLKEWSAK